MVRPFILHENETDTETDTDNKLSVSVQYEHLHTILYKPFFISVSVLSSANTP